MALHTQYAVFSASFTDAPQKILDSLGGTIKIYEIVATIDRKEETSLSEVVLSYLESLPRGGKLTFALNVFGKNDRVFQKELILSLKKGLREAGIGSRFVNHDFNNTTSVQSFHERLADKGSEVAVFFHYHRIFIGRLAASQNIEQYTRRDTGKPARNMEVGLMPPKLAQILINLAAVQPPCTIYDPFCGTGGILIEALRMGYGIAGADIDPRVLEQADANLRWYQKEMGLNTVSRPPLFVQDATKPFSRQLGFDALVTEGYLGPVLRSDPSETEIAQVHTEVARLYSGLLGVLQTVNITSIPIVLCVPVFYRDRKPYYLNGFAAIVRSCGFDIDPLLAPESAQILGIDLTRGSLVYRRDGQFVGREIFRLIKL